MSTSTPTPTATPAASTVSRGFHALNEADIRAIVRRVGFVPDGSCNVRYPEQGVNNQTYIVSQRDAPDLVIKVRPAQSRASRMQRAGRNNRYWPLYTQKLLGPYPNGDVATMIAIARVLKNDGALRVPEIYDDDDSLELVPAPYLVSEKLEGRSFGWFETPFTTRAAQQLGEHLGRLHAATRGPTWGIYARRDDFEAEKWWPRFGRAFNTILRELAALSPSIADVRRKLLAALQNARDTGTPAGFSLMCIDQAPSHYLCDENGAIAGMIDVEAHLWAPPAYELAMVELWVKDVPAFRAAYQEHSPYPAQMEAKRPAFCLMTWMEWIYCAHTLLHDEGGAKHMENVVVDQLARLEHTPETFGQV